MESGLRLGYLLQRRRVVIHHTHLLAKEIAQQLRANDVVFFDDCLFSQYMFLRENQDLFKELAIDCILGFSSGLYAAESCKSQMHAVESHILHDACNKSIASLEDADQLRDSLPEMCGFMKVSQLKELLDLPFCHLALHGCCHLKLEHRMPMLRKLLLFKKDLDAGVSRLSDLNLQTTMYVYPYVYSFAGSDTILKRTGFTTVVGSARACRTSIESLIDGKADDFA